MGLFGLPDPKLQANTDDVAIDHDFMHMQSFADMSASGSIGVVTNTWSTSPLVGFTGGVFVAVLDGGGNVIGNTQVHQYGVNGTLIPGGPSKRQDPFTQDLGTAIGANATQLKIVQFHDPQNRLIQDLVELVKIGEDVASTVKAICDADSDVCDMVKTALLGAVFA
jgi:hypothetical protein